MPFDPRSPAISMRGAAMAGAIGSLLLLGIILGWAGYTQISSAVVAQGTVTVVGKPKAVQHLDGGIVQDILVSDGDLVELGDVLIRLDSALLTANLEIYRNRFSEALARHARLIAERDGAPAPVFATNHPLLPGRDLALMQANEAAVFTARAEIQAGRHAQIEERIRQFSNQIDGVDALIAAKRDQLGFIETELTRQRALQEKQLVRESQVLTLEGTRADILGQIAEHLTEAARIGNSIRDAELETLQTDRQFKEQAVIDLNDTTVQLEELAQQITTTQKQLERVDIRAPVRGLVHELQTVTTGGVVPAGATIAQIIASDADRSFEFKVAPTSVDQVFIGQPVRLRFSAFNHRTTPELSGEVSGVSPTTIVDEVTRAPYYRVSVHVPQTELARLGDLVLVPGMPIEGYIGTGARSVASYLTKPIVEQFRHAFREE